MWILLLGLLGGCEAGREPVEGGNCDGNERRCDGSNTPFECGDDSRWEESPPYCVCVADADDDGFAEVQCAAVALK